MIGQTPRRLRRSNDLVIMTGELKYKKVGDRLAKIIQK
jgi:hypothetical protein